MNHQCMKRKWMVFTSALLLPWVIFPVVAIRGAGGLVSIPMKWAAIAGSPSEVDPALVGEGNIRDVLWRRHERISEFRLIPTCTVTLRSGAFDAVPNFPVIADPMAIGNPGDINLGPDRDDFTEFYAAIDAARAAWTALGFAGDFGITSVSMNRFVDDTGAVTGVLGLGGFSATSCNAAVQAVIGRAMVIDPAYLLAISPLQVFTDPNETILGQEVLHGLTLDHVADSNNLMFEFFPNGGALDAGQCTVIQDQSTAHVPGTMVDPVPEPFVDFRADPRNDVEDPLIDIHLGGVARDTANAQTYFFVSTTGLFFESGNVVLDFFFVLDADDDELTGGAAGDVGVPTDAIGIELVGIVHLKGDGPEASAEFYTFLDGEFVLIRDPRIAALVDTEYVSVLSTDGAVNHAVGEIIQIRVPDDLIGKISTIASFQAASINVIGKTMDTTEKFGLTFLNPVFPTCFVEPPSIVNGGTVTLIAEGLPPNEGAHIFLGALPVGDGEIDEDGNLNIQLTLKIDDPGIAEAHLLTVGTEETAITADCIVTIARLCVGDVNGDGLVDPLDKGFILARFGCLVGTGDPDCDAADQNGDGLVNPLDAGFVKARFGECE